MTSSAPTNRKSAERQEGDELERALVGDDEELGAEDAVGERLEPRAASAARSASSAASALTVSMPRIASICRDEYVPNASSRLSNIGRSRVAEKRISPA